MSDDYTNLVFRKQLLLARLDAIELIMDAAIRQADAVKEMIADVEKELEVAENAK